MQKYNIIAVDFDGTLSCDAMWPAIGKPNQKLFTYLKDRQNKGDKIILWTCRSGELLKVAVEWCRNQGLEFNAVNENLQEVVELYNNDSRKISCDLYIDDKSFNPTVNNILDMAI